MSEITFFAEKNENDSKDVVLDLELITPTENVHSTKPYHLLSPDNRRQQLLSNLQSILCERSSHDQPESILTKEKFINLFQSNVSCTHTCN